MAIFHTLKLTEIEHEAVLNALCAINENIEWDKKNGTYTENHVDFIYSCSKQEKMALNRIVHKKL